MNVDLNVNSTDYKEQIVFRYIFNNFLQKK